LRFRISCSSVEITRLAEIAQRRLAPLVELVCLVYLVCFVYLDCLVGEKQREKSGTNGGFISFIWFVLLA
jgi:hypothetical protein